MSKTGIVVIARDELAGDALMAQPAIEGLAQKYDVVFLAFRNEKVLEILDLPANVASLYGNEPFFNNLHLPVQMLGVFASIGFEYKFPLNAHPTETLMIFAGCGRPDTIPQPKIKITPVDVPRYDVVLAPWSRGEVKSMQGIQALNLIREMQNKWSVALIGGPDDLAPASMKAHTFYGKDYNWVANLMIKAKCVVSVDSFPSRLAHAAGVKRHVILNSKVVPWIWQSHPGAVEVQSTTPPSRYPEWDLQEITTAIEWSGINVAA